MGKSIYVALSDNPHLKRLARQPRHFVFDITTGFVLAWLVMNLIIVAYGVLQLRGTLNMFIAAGGLLALYAIVVGPYLAWLTATDASRAHYQLLRLTLLTRHDLVWGYIWGGLRRFHHETGIPVFAVPPMIIIMDLIILLAASTRFRFNQIDIPFQVEVFAFMGVISMAGLSLFSVTSSVALGLWLRKPIGAFSASLALQVLSLGMLYLAVLRLADHPALLNYVVLLGMPLLMAFGGLKFAYRLAD